MLSRLSLVKKKLRRAGCARSVSSFLRTAERPWRVKRENTTRADTPSKLFANAVGWRKFLENGNELPFSAIWCRSGWLGSNCVDNIPRIHGATTRAPRPGMRPLKFVLCNKAIHVQGVLVVCGVWCVVWVTAPWARQTKWDKTTQSKQHAPHTCTALLHAHACCAAEAHHCLSPPCPTTPQRTSQPTDYPIPFYLPICTELDAQLF
jgi:hypothetical protein